MTATLNHQERIDPATAWEPWRPTADDPWGPKWAGHLYRRAAFGASREELIEAQRLGPQGTLDLLMAGRPGADELLETLTDAGRVATRDDTGDQLRGWWLYCMLQGGHPLRDKLTLFWHNHFATSLVKVQHVGLMFRQNCLLRRHALGHFGPMLQDVSRDPAMLVWLDSNANVKGRPNENYARELMELFSLGVGHYTEHDIREAARAFTGWHTDGYGFAFDARDHDDGPKTVLGRTGNWDGGDVVDIVLGRPDAARFVVGKLYQFLVSERAAPPPGLLEPLCDRFRKCGYDVAALVRTILASRHFYSDHAVRKRVKGPVEYMLGAVRAVYRRFDEGQPEYRPLRQQVLVGWLGGMGQQLFAPPNVKGWPGGRAWLNTATLVQRANFAATLADGTLWTDPATGSAGAATGAGFALRDMAPSPAVPAESPQEVPPPLALDPARVVREEGASGPEEIVRVLLELHLPGGVRPEARTRLVAFVAEGRPSGAALERRVREAVHAIWTMPEYQLA
jgi:hypothetical protein